MKRITMYLIGILASVLAFGSVAVAADATLYGRVVSGIIHDKADGSDGAWDLGSVDAGSANGDVGGPGAADRLFSRIGVKISHDLGNGMTSGAHLEKRLDGWRTRHQNVWLEGGLGRVTLGQQSLPFYGAVAWDGANFTGGFADPGSRGSGVNFGSNLGGPFDFDVMLRDDNSVNRGQSSEDAVDEYQITGSFDTGIATISVGYVGKDDDGPYSVGGAVGGAVGAMSWKFGYHAHEDDRNVYGLHVGYGLGDGNLYGQYEDCNVDDDKENIDRAAHTRRIAAAGEMPVPGDFPSGRVGDHAYDNAVALWRARTDSANAALRNASDDACGSAGWVDDHSIIVGYSHKVGPQTRIIAEHRNLNEGADRTILALRVDF